MLNKYKLIPDHHSPWLLLPPSALTPPSSPSAWASMPVPWWTPHSPAEWHRMQRALFS